MFSCPSLFFKYLFLRKKESHTIKINRNSVFFIRHDQLKLAALKKVLSLASPKCVTKEKGRFNIQNELRRTNKRAK